MANEFKVKKGLILDGSNTVLDIQGTQGQLFSVTDSLTGDLFSVSDVSGIPILTVNSSGLSTFDGSADFSGIIKLTKNTATGLANNAFSHAKTIIGGLHFANGNGPGANNGNQAAITFQGSTASEAQAGIYVHNNNSQGTHMLFATTDSYNTGPKAGITLLNNGNVTIRGTVGASNFSGTSSGTNTGDQDLSGYATSATTLAGYGITNAIEKGVQIASAASWTTATRFGSTGAISQAAGNHALSVRSENNNDAFMSFHIGADYAVHFGLDGATNRMHVGGWSDGTGNQYQLYDSRDFSVANVLNSNVTLASLGAQAAGSYLTSDANYLKSNTSDTATGEILFDAGFKSDSILLSGSQNFDNISRSGFYNLYNTQTNSTNSPGFDYGTMIVVGGNKQNASFGLQIAHERTGAGMYVRGMNDTASAWSAWREMAVKESNGDLRFNDSKMILLGSSTSNPSQDARIYHNGTDTYFENATGELRLMSDTWALRSSTTEILSYNTTDDIIKSTAKALQLGNGSVGSSDARLICKRMDTGVADDIQFFNGTTRVGEIGVKDTTWLRINQHTAKNIYTPRYIRADNGFFVDSTSKGINGSGNFIGGTITGASDANVSNWNTAYTHSQSAHAPSNAQANVINYISYSGTNNFIVNGTQNNEGTTIPTGSQIIYADPSSTQIVSRGLVSDLPFIRNNADDTFTGKLSVGSSSSRRAGMYGIYNSSLIGHIWSMGTAYQIPQNGANFGNLYGLAYKHTNNTTGGTMAGSHQMVWCQNGTGKSAMGTNIWTSGSYTGASISVTGSASFVTSGTGTLTCGGAGIFGGSGTGDVYVGNFGSGNFARFHTNNSNTYFDMNCGVVYWRQGSSTRFQNNMTSGTFTASGDVVAYGSPSDVRLKENIKPIESALDKVSRLQGVTFDWKQSDSILNIKEDVGFIAQDVQKVVPELVRENEDGMLSMRHQGIAPILLEAIKELKAEIEELKKCNKCNNCNCKTNNDGGTK